MNTCKGKGLQMYLWLSSQNPQIPWATPAALLLPAANYTNPNISLEPAIPFLLEYHTSQCDCV